MATVKVGNHYGLVHTSGEICLPIKYDALKPLHDGRLWIARLVDMVTGCEKSGKLVDSTTYDEMSKTFSDGHVAVETNPEMGGLKVNYLFQRYTIQSTLFKMDLLR